jgi:hypothetical protein
VTAAVSWREEARRDRLTRAQIDRDREAARARLRREDAHARTAARTQARRARAARRAARAGWVRGHAVGLLFVPVITVPAVLAWTAMAAYGALLYGPAGRSLPAFSEGAMWAFAAATTITRRRHPDRPVWHLRAGTAGFAAVGAALNFAHGMTAAAGLRGPMTGAVYAVISVAGVTVHQLVTAGPRRTRAERDAARLARAAAGPACPWPRPAPVLPAAPARPAPRSAPAPGTAPAPGGAPGRTHTRRPSAPRNRTRTPASGVTAEAAEVHFAADLADGRVPSARRIKADLHVGQARAAQIRDHLATVAATPGGTGPRELSGSTS